MIPTVKADVREATRLLTQVEGRLADFQAAWLSVADDVFNFEKRWWVLTYGAQTDQDTRPGRNPAYMEETGGLRAAATEKHAKFQTIQPRPTYLFIGITHGLANIHEERGREVIGVPGQAEAANMAEKVARFILTGGS